MMEDPKNEGLVIVIVFVVLMLIYKVYYMISR